MSDVDPRFHSGRLTSLGDWSASRCIAAKGQQSIAVVLPARNEGQTVGSVVRALLSQPTRVWDRLLVVDSLSSDDTAKRVVDEGAEVMSVAEIRADLGVFAGKGEALWKSLFVVDEDILVFLDADLTQWHPEWVQALCGPLLDDPAVMLVRAFYDRVTPGSPVGDYEGGRVTEILARPWISLFVPELGHVIQPLGGEWAIRRSAFERLWIPSGYGVEMAVLLQTYEKWGLDSIAQVDLGTRGHVPRPLRDLSSMALEVLMASEEWRRRRDDENSTLGWRQVLSPVSMARLAPDRSWHLSEVTNDMRPPWRTFARSTDTLGP